MTIKTCYLILAAVLTSVTVIAVAACGGPALATNSASRPTVLRSTSVARPVQRSAAKPAFSSSPRPAQKDAEFAATPTQLPAFKAESWVAQAAGPELTVTGHNIELNECASVDGATTWQQQPYESSGGDSAILETYTFTSPAAASAAYAGVLSGMNQCQTTSRALQAANHIPADALVAETAHTPYGAAFERTWTGVQGISAAGPQINHLYVAMQGTTILVLHFDQLNATSSSTGTYSVRNDPAVLTMLTNLLAANAVGT